MKFTIESPTKAMLTEYIEEIIRSGLYPTTQAEMNTQEDDRPYDIAREIVKEMEEENG